MKKATTKTDDVDRLIKVMNLARTATQMGERAAAKAAAKRLAKKLNIDLQDKNAVASLLHHRDNDSTNDTYQQAPSNFYEDDMIKHRYRHFRHKDFGAWSTNEYYARQQTMHARKKSQEFYEEKYQQDNHHNRHAKKDSFTPRYHRTYQQSSKDLERLVLGLIRDGTPFKRIEKLLNISHHDVTKIWLRYRHMKNKYI